MRTILITAYAADPFKGSEDGTGWNTASAIARDHKVVMVTRRNNLPHITKYLEAHPHPAHANMTFIGHDLPVWAMRLKKRLGERGYVAYFYLWQLTLPFLIRRLRIEFDIAHALNFHSDSTPQFLWLLGRPVVWGPIGHHPPVPREFVVPQYGRGTYLKDALYNKIKWCLRNLDPLFRLSVHRSDKIIGINSGVARAMRAPGTKVTVLPAVAAVPVEPREGPNELFTVLSIGRFVYMKGFDLTIRAFAHFTQKLNVEERRTVRLTLVGKGEEKEALEKLSKELGIADRIDWIDWVDRDTMDAIYRRSNVLLFPSHEGAGMVVPEAMAHGLPVVCLDNIGPGELVGPSGLKVPYGGREEVVSSLSNLINELYQDPAHLATESRAARTRHANYFTWGHKASVINALYDEILAPVADPSVKIPKAA